MGCMFAKSEPAPNPAFDNVTKGTVISSWPKFMENGGDYGMDAFLVAIEEHSEELRKYFNIIDIAEDEIREHPHVMTYIAVMVQWLDAMVNNIDDKAEYKKQLRIIAQKHKIMNLPMRTAVLYKDGYLKFIETKGLFTPEEVDKWRKFLNKALSKFEHDYSLVKK